MPAQPKCMYENFTCDPETFSKTNVTKLCPRSQCTFAFYGGESLYHKYIFILQICNVFVFLWLVNFAIALGQCTLAGAFASYYWAFKKPGDVPASPLFSSFGRAIRYHTGSLAFGSLILAIVQLIRIILEYLDHKLKRILHCYWEFSTLRGKPGADVTISDIGFQTDFRVYLQLSQTWLIFMICLCIIEATIILILIFLRNRVRIAIALLKEGSKAIGHIMSTLFYPIVTFLLIAICISYWAVTAVFLASSGEPIYKVMPAQPKCMYENFTCDPETFSKTNVTKLCPRSQCTFAFYGGESLYHKYIFILQICNVFVFLWLVNFAIALGQCTLAGAFASYYWAFKKPGDVPASPLFSSFGRAIRYHTGSLAFGSLILAIVQLIRIILEYLDHKLKTSASNVVDQHNYQVDTIQVLPVLQIRFVSQNNYEAFSIKLKASPNIYSRALHHEAALGFQPESTSPNRLDFTFHCDDPRYMYRMHHVTGPGRGDDTGEVCRSCSALVCLIAFLLQYKLEYLCGSGTSASFRSVSSHEINHEESKNLNPVFTPLWRKRFKDAPTVCDCG
ncbi:UNVERIFIED_CONTAM: hypothetical protein FKN15_048839 [Acipenser sinensis]